MAVILVIDDNDTVRKTLRRQLLSAGHEVIEAADSAQGGRHRDDRRHSTRAFRDQDQCRVPGSEPQQRALYLGAAQKLGADAALAKPWRAAKLKEIVERLLAA